MTTKPVPHEVIPCDRLPAGQYRDLPEPPHWRKLIGPSILLLGLSLGSGEFVLWPYITYKFGFVVFWACMVGVLTQYFINMEIERWTLATGETAVTGFCRQWSGWAGVFLVCKRGSVDVAGLGVWSGDHFDVGVWRRREYAGRLFDCEFVGGRIGIEFRAGGVPHGRAHSDGADCRGAGPVGGHFLFGSRANSRMGHVQGHRQYRLYPRGNGTAALFRCLGLCGCWRDDELGAERFRPRQRLCDGCVRGGG